MIKFDLEKALAGDKVVTRDGREVTQLHVFKHLHQEHETIYGVLDEEVRSYFSNGVYDEAIHGSKYDLFMAPKQLSGFINVYRGKHSGWHATRKSADEAAVRNGCRTECIDLSQFTEGHGLDEV